MSKMHFCFATQTRRDGESCPDCRLDTPKGLRLTEESITDEQIVWFYVHGPRTVDHLNAHHWATRANIKGYRERGRTLLAEMINERIAACEERGEIYGIPGLPFPGITPSS
jgi:hypothetical protein